jgi:hypothetical protein
MINRGPGIGADNFRQIKVAAGFANCDGLIPICESRSQIATLEQIIAN